MAKKLVGSTLMTKKLDRVWVIVKDNELYSVEAPFDKAKKMAIDLLEQGEEVKILEVVAAWEVEWPEEPDPELYKIDMGEIV